MASAQDQKIVSLRQSIGHAKKRFEEIALKDGTGLVWAKESMFAMQVIEKSNYLQNCTLESIRKSVINIASIGLSLNPAEKMAYLIPRKNKYKDANGKWQEEWEACLDISYRGMVKIATDSGAIRWAKAMLVHEGEDFEWIGVDEKPVHKISNPFGRKENNVDVLVGGYSIAKTSDGDYLCDMMSAEDILAIRDRSDAYKFGQVGKKGPWESDFGQMAKKTLLRRGAVSWPISERFMHAEAELNLHQGTTFNDTAVEPDEPQELLINEAQVTELQERINVSKVNPARIFTAFGIEQLADLPVSRFEDCKSRLDDAMAAHDAKILADEAAKK